MKKVLLWIWQLPQNTVGYILAKSSKYKVEYTWHLDTDFYVYYRELFNSGVCLGDYIIIDGKYADDAQTIMHEYGHHLQSVRLGWFYLLLIGLPSLIFNIWDRVVHKKWTRLQRKTWYYNLPWEAWADRLVEIVR